MKRLSIFFAALLTSVGCMIAAESVAYQVVAEKGTNFSYTGSGDIVVNGITWTAQANANVSTEQGGIGGWGIGGKNITAVNRAIFSKNSIAATITKVVVTHKANNGLTVNSFALIVSDESNVAGDTIWATADDLTKMKNANAVVEFAIPEGKTWANKYYKFLYNVTNTDTKKNKRIEFYSADFIGEVKDVPATAIVLDKETLTIEQYKSAQLKATLTPAEAITSVVWSSSEMNVATVGTDGTIWALATGTTNITATAGELTATCAVTVTEATPISCAQAVEIAKTVTANNVAAEGGKYLIRGYVTALVGTPSDDMSKYKNYSVWMADTKDGGEVFEAFQVKPVDGKTIAAVGDYVEVIGDITKYNKDGNTTYETMGKGTATIQILSMRGNYTIGILDGCDYASLAEAFTAYNNYAQDNMVSGDVTFQVATDLAEPKNVGLQNPTDYTVTLTVDKAEARTISFSQAGDNAGPSGNICIGCDMTLTHTCASVETKNVVLDGSFNGSEENYLTIKSVAGCHKLNGPVLVYGNVKNTTIKNCNLIAENGVGSSIYPITIRSQKGTDYAPENIVVDGNYIEANKGTADQGIYFQLTTTGKVKPANVTISNNEIVARTRGIFMGGINGATIKNNTIKINQTATGMLSYGIWGYQNTEGEFNIEGNMIQELATNANVEAAGIYGIVANAGKWYIRNNYVSGFNVLATAADNIALVGIQGASAADTVVIEHNTVAMAEQTNKVANASAAKICLIKAVSGKASVKNNLVVSNEAGFANALVSPAGIMENNVYCTKSYVGSADSIKALVDYKTIHETTAKSVESVVFENLAQGILDLVDASNGDVNLGVARLADVTTDIYGTERAEFTYAGAFEGKAIQQGPGTDVEDIDVAGAEVQKIIRNGQVLIIRDGKTYNMMGQIVE